MNISRKIIGTVLCGVMLSGLLVSCGGGGKNTAAPSQSRPSSGGEPDEMSTTLSAEELEAIDTRIASLEAEVPNGFDGEVFNVLAAEKASFFPTEENLINDPENDSIYKRNCDVETAFKIKMVNTRDKDPNYLMDRLRNDINGGIYTFNLVNSGVVSTGQYIFQDMLITPVDQFSDINLDSPWWQDSLEEYYAIGDRLFFLSGDISPSYFSAPACVLYSKQIMKDYGINDDLYDSVYAGEWTIDKMFETAAAVPGGGDVYRYGCSSDEGPGSALYFGAGYTITKFDAEHYPYMEKALPEGAYDLMVKVSAQTGDPTLCYGIDYAHQGPYKEHTSEEAQDLFASDRILFYFAGGGDISELRELDVSGFGILPIPKADVSQKNYISYARSEGPAIYFPKNEADVKMTGIITEAMGAYGYKYIRPAYYDQRLKSKGVYDIESKAMLDLIYSNQVYDLYDLYGGGSYEVGNGVVVKSIHTAVITDPEGIVSGYAANARAFGVKIKSMIATAEKYD